MSEEADNHVKNYPNLTLYAYGYFILRESHIEAVTKNNIKSVKQIQDVTYCFFLFFSKLLGNRIKPVHL